MTATEHSSCELQTDALINKLFSRQIIGRQYLTGLENDGDSFRVLRASRPAMPAEQGKRSSGDSMIEAQGADSAAAIPIPPPIQREARQFFERP